MRPTPTATCLAQRGPDADMLWRCEFCCRAGSGAGLRWSAPQWGLFPEGSWIVITESCAIAEEVHAVEGVLLVSCV